MGFLKSVHQEKFLAIIKQLRLIDDTFFSICFDENIECMQLLLRIILQHDDLIVTEVVTQRSAQNLYGRGVRFDVLAKDSNGKLYNVEIQRADEGANPKRAHYNHCLIASHQIEKGTDYKDFPETWVIFITEKDAFKRGLPMYHIERMVTELKLPFADEAHTIYVNGAYRAHDAIGILMEDFFCTDPAKMHYKELAKCVGYFKYENKGVNTMCEIMEKLQDESRIEGRTLMAMDMAMDMLRDHKPMEEIIKYSRLPEERIKELAQKI